MTEALFQRFTNAQSANTGFISGCLLKKGVIDKKAEGILFALEILNLPRSPDCILAQRKPYRYHLLGKTQNKTTQTAHLINLVQDFFHLFQSNDLVQNIKATYRSKEF